MKKLLCAFAVMSVSGCECLFGFPPGGFNFDAGQFVLPKLVDGGELKVAHDQCVPTPEMVSGAQLLTAVRLPAVADGVVDSPLSPTGCLVVRDEYRGGRRVALSVRQFMGILEVVDEPKQLYREMETVYLDVTLGEGRSMHANFDVNGDGKRDGEVNEVRAGGLLQARTMTRYDGANGNVTRRETMTVFDLDRMHFKVEQLVAGVLTPVSDFDAPTRQRQTLTCYGPRAPMGTADTVPCGKTDAELRTLVHDAIASYSSCLSAYGTWSFAQLEAFLLDDIKADEMSIECFRDPTYFGEAQSANDTLRLNVDLLSGCEGANFVNSTIVHEMLHFTRGPHEFQDPTGPYGPRAAAYSDPMRACEELCYGTLKTKCSCARCLGTKACDSRCSGLASCRVDPPDGGAATMSEAVGALCKSTNTWFSTMASCGATGACPDGAGGCKSYSLSCDSSCQ